MVYNDNMVPEVVLLKCPRLLAADGRKIRTEEWRWWWPPRGNQWPEDNRLLLYIVFHHILMESHLLVIIIKDIP